MTLWFTPDFYRLYRRVTLGALASFSLYSPLALGAASDDFVITVKTDNTGISSNVQFTLPTTGSGYNYNIDCNNDGSDEATAQTGDYTCDYTGLGGAGTYTVRIKDNSGAGTGFPRIYFNKTGDRQKLLTIQQWGTGKWTSMEKSFSGALNLTVPATDVPDLSGVTSTINMFWDAVLANPDVSNWDVSNVTKMNNMFLSASAATPDVSNWDVSNVENMSALFSNATSANPDVSNWNVSKVAFMNSMFYNAQSATPNVSNWDVSGAQQMESMFHDAIKANPDVSNWDVSNVTKMGRMFSGATLATPDTSSWDTSAATEMQYMFYNAPAANPDVSGWDVSKVTNMQGLFYNATAATPDTISWNTGAVLNMSQLFRNTPSSNPNVSSWNVSQVTNMDELFMQAPSATPDTSGWDTSSVTSMKFMFYDATSANPDVSNWDVSNVKNMLHMFFGASSATPVTTSWDVSAVTNMQGMFYNATSAAPNTSNWDTSSVLNMSQLFFNASSANPDVSSWDVSKVTTMSELFKGASSATPNTSSWNTSAVTNMQSMFYQATSANPDVSNWDVSKVTNMLHMFFGASSATPDTSNWDVSKVENMQGLFYNATAANPNTANWDTSAVLNMSQMFNSATSANPDVSNWDVSKVTNMDEMFQQASVATPDTSAWSTAAVTSMRSMFYQASAANPDVSNWDVSNVSNMTYMFYQATSANPDISGWNVVNATQMVSMLSGTTLSTSIYDATLANWSGLSLQNGVSFDAGNSTFCNGETAKNTIIANDSWTITDSGKDCPNLHFVTTWKTDNPGSSSSTSITIPTTGTGYSYDVDWNNDNVFDEFGLTGDATHDFGTTGTYTIRIRGDFPRIYFNNGGDRQKILSVEQWGSNVWSSMQNAFYGATNLTINATDAPVLSTATSLRAMFRDARSMNSAIGHWDTSNITNMLDMFNGATAFDQNISNWDTSKVFTMQGMFEGASAFNQNLSTWDTSTVISMLTMFQDATAFNQPIGNWDTAKVTNMSFLFDGATAFNQDISTWDTGTVTVMVSTFQDATSFDQNLANWDISGVGNMGLMFSGVTLSKSNYDAILVGFNAQTLKPAVQFDGGNSVYCTGESARANMIASDGWVITDSGKQCAPNAPSQAPDLLAGSDSGSASDDNVTADSTPNFNITCSNSGNLITLYTDNPSASTSVATLTCSSSGLASVTASTLAHGSHNISYTDTTGAYESTPSPTLLLQIDTVGPATPNCSTAPSSAANNTNVTTTCNAVETGASIDITNMTCTPNPASATNIVSCSGTVGSSGGQITVSNDSVTVTDAAGNTNSSASTNLVIDNISPIISQISMVTTPTADTTPDYSFSSSEAGNISYFGSCSSATTLATGGTNTITFNTLSDGNYIDCQIQIADVAGNLSNVLSVNAFEIDSSAPTLAEVTAVPTPTSDSTPDYSFSSTEAGNISYAGSCSSAATTAVSGSNTITFNALSDGNFSDCQISVTDATGNQSNHLNVSAFEIDSSAPTLAEVTAVPTPTADSTPDYSFSSTEAGNISYAGSCSSVTTTAASGSNTITFNALSDGNFSDCQISVTDATGNQSNLLNISAFEIDSSAPTLAEVTAVPTPTSDSTPDYSFSSTEAGNISYAGSCSSAATTAVSGSNTITFNALSDGNFSDCQISVTDATGNQSNLLSVSAFEIDRSAPTLAEVTAVPTPTSDTTPDYSFSSTEAGNISYLGSCSSTATAAISGSNTITFNALSNGRYADCQISVTDATGNQSNLLSVSTFEIDSDAPILVEVTAVPTPTADTTPDYSFSSTEAGNISYVGSCSSTATTAVSGSNTITFNALSDGRYADCQIQVIDATGSASNLLTVSAFEIDSAPPALAEVTAVPTPTADTTPGYSFSSTEAGTISYSGSCSSTSTSAVVGVNTLEFNELANGTYSDCALRLTDISGNVSSPLYVTEFTVDTLLLGLEISLPSEVLQNEEITVEPRVIGGKAPFIFSAENLPSWIQQDTGSGQLKTSPTREDVGSYDGIVFQVSDSEGRVASSQLFEIRVVAVNSPPVAQDDTITFMGGTISVAVLENDWDPDEGDTLTITDTTALLGSVTIDGDNLVYQSPTNFTGMDIIEYTITDSSDLTASAKVSVSVNHDDSLGGAPQISLPPDVEVNATGLLTPVTLGYATAIDYVGNPIGVTRSSGTVFRPGVHQVLWTAEDSQGLKASLVQQVIVHPLISIEPGSRVQEGESTSVKVHLNGDAPQYPVELPYSIAGTANEDDHDLDEENIIVAEGWKSQINFNTVLDNLTEEDETLIIQLDETINLARQASYTLTISEMPTAPSVSLKSYQDGIETLVINQSLGGIVTVKSVNISGDTENAQLRWESSQQLVNLSSDPRLFKFDPQELDPGNLHIALTVYAINATQTTASINLALSKEAKVMQPSKPCSIINEQIDDGFWFLAETELRACIMRGNTALNSHSGGIQILSEEQKKLLGTELPLDKGVFDFTLFGKSAGDSYQVVLPQRKPIPEQATYLIYSTETGDWREFETDSGNSLFSAPSSEGLCPEIAANHWRPGLTAGDWCVRLTIQDGGTNDTDPDPNGIVSATIALTDSANMDGSNKAPVAQNDLFEITATEAPQLQVLVNDSDEDGDQLILIEADAELGAVEIVGDDIRYILPAGDFLGRDTIKYLISDQQGGFASAIATIEVTSGNRIPVAQDDRLTIFVNSYGVADVLANDSDPDNTPLSIEQVTSDSGYTWVRDGKLYIVPELDFIGTISVSYLAVDSKGGKAKAGLTVKVIKPLSVTSGGSSDGYIMLILLAILIVRICLPLINRARAVEVLRFISFMTCQCCILALRQDRHQKG